MFYFWIQISSFKTKKKQISCVVYSFSLCFCKNCFIIGVPKSIYSQVTEFYAYRYTTKRNILNCNRNQSFIVPVRKYSTLHKNSPNLPVSMNWSRIIATFCWLKWSYEGFVDTFMVFLYVLYNNIPGDNQ